MDNKELKEAITKWENDAPLYTQLPIIYKTGVSFKEIEGKCLVCSSNIEKNNLHGVINRPIESVVNVEAIGWCQSCNTLTPFSFRVRGDNGELTLEWLDHTKGWCKSSSQKNFVEKVLNWIM